MPDKKYYTSTQVQELDRFSKINLINSITGFKSANLLATINDNGVTNLAVFNSVCHLGSEPAMIHFTLRPHTVSRHTYENILANTYFSINAIAETFVEKAHQTSAKYDAEISEFDATGLTATFKNNFKAPYVEESPVQIGCKYLNTYEIKENGCLLIVAAIEEIYIDNNIIDEDCFINLDKANIASIVGLDGYYQPKKIARFDYARP